MIEYTAPEVVFFEVMRLCRPAKPGDFAETLMKALELDRSHGIVPNDS
jgi:hypothetical protein